MRSCDFRRVMAVALVLTTTFVTMPLSAADFSTARPVLGSVNAVGPVELRGVGISEGTLFSGDSIRAREKGYAKVLIGTGSKIELSEKTDVNVNREGDAVKIAMNTGMVGFTARTLLRIDVLPFEVIASDGASGNVAIMSSTTAGVRAINGKLTVRNLKTSESFVMTKGQERLLGLKDGVHAPSLGEIASNVPGPIPAPPQTPAGKTGGGLAMDTGAWLAVIGGAAVAGIAIWGLVEARNNRDDVKALGGKIDSLTATVAANNAANQAALRNLSNANAIANAVTQQQAQLALTTALAAQAQLALQASGNTAAAAQVASISAQAAASAQRLSALQSAIAAAQARLAAGTGSSTEVNNLLQQEEQERQNSNNLANQLNALLNANSGTAGVPSGRVGTTGPPAQSSASIPV